MPINNLFIYENMSTEIEFNLTDNEMNWDG